MNDDTNFDMVELATELTVAWLANANNRANVDDVPAFLRSMHATLTDLTSGKASSHNDVGPVEHVGAVSVRKSLASKDHILSMIDGKPYKTLRRHLSGHGLTPEQYRERYNLKADYPMVSETYSQARREMAMKIGLGSKGRIARSEAPATSQSPTKRQRKTPATS